MQGKNKAKKRKKEKKKRQSLYRFLRQGHTSTNGVWLQRAWLKKYKWQLLFVGFVCRTKSQRLCIDFSVSVLANYLTTLHSHLDITCSCYFLSNLRINVVYSYSCSFFIKKDRASWFHRFLVLFKNNNCEFLLSNFFSIQNWHKLGKKISGNFYLFYLRTTTVNSCTLETSFPFKIGTCCSLQSDISNLLALNGDEVNSRWTPHVALSTIICLLIYKWVFHFFICSKVVIVASVWFHHQGKIIEPSSYTIW